MDLPSLMIIKPFIFPLYYHYFDKLTFRGFVYFIYIFKYIWRVILTIFSLNFKVPLFKVPIVMSFFICDIGYLYFIFCFLFPFFAVYFFPWKVHLLQSPLQINFGMSQHSVPLFLLYDISHPLLHLTLIYNFLFKFMKWLNSK